MRLAVLGDPVAHSRSPLLHRTALAVLGIPGDYVAMRADAAGMRDAVEAIRDGDLDGANVTMPHKRLAVELADLAAPGVDHIGAANTLVRVGDRVVAHNTDVPGIVHAWRWAGLPDAPVLVLGAGGAAAAAVVAAGDREVHLSARDVAAAQRLSSRLGDRADAIPWGTAVPGAVVVNATPLGMAGEPLPADVLHAAAGLLDMAYGGGETPAAARMRRRRLPIADGSDMLLGQAVESFRLWTGCEAPLAAMRQSLATADR